MKWPKSEKNECEDCLEKEAVMGEVGAAELLPTHKEMPGFIVNAFP